MAAEWETVQLSDLTTKITKGTTPTKNDGGFVQEGINFIKAECVTMNGSIDVTKFTFVTEEVHNKYARSHLQEGDVLFSMAGVILGKTAIVQSHHLPANTNQALALIRPKQNTIASPYLHYFLQNPSVFHYVNNSTSQSAQPNINLKEIGDLEITLPPLPEQKAIAHVLGSLDDKIELNRRMNETLEGMAQALFKSWFVDFDPVIDNALAAGNPIPEPLAQRAETRRQAIANGAANRESAQSFPASFRFTEELGWIPEGWQAGSIADLAKLNPESWTNKKHPDSVNYVDLANTKNGRINETTLYEFEKAPSRARRILKPHDTILGTVRPENRSFAYIQDNGLTGSTGFAVLRPVEASSRSFIYLSLTQDDVIKVFAHLADGAAYPAIRPEVVSNTHIAIPNASNLQVFELFGSTLLRKIGEHQQESQTLAKLRDVLLPKLISGELSIPQAEKMVEKAIA
jgi:type I restriction enzyme S subunit